MIVKKKHYIGTLEDENMEPVIKGMEGIKSDRHVWINKIERQFAGDIKVGNDPTVKIRKQYMAMERGQVLLDELEIKLMLAKDPSEYGMHSLQRVVGNELGAKQGDTIVYYKSEIAGGGTSNPNLISRKKYLEMLWTTVEDSLKIMEYDFDRYIVGYRRLDDNYK